MELKWPILGVRHTLVFLGFLGLVNVYSMRVNLSVAIVYMVNNTAINATSSDKDGQEDGGRLAELVGGKWLFGSGVLVTAILTLLTPLAASTSVYLLYAVRIIEGLAEGVCFPSIYAMLARWAPPEERSRQPSINPFVIMIYVKADCLFLCWS